MNSRPNWEDMFVIVQNVNTFLKEGWTPMKLNEVKECKKGWIIMQNVVST